MFSGQTGTISVQGSFPNPGRILRPGQYARVRAAVETHRNALLVPQRAITELQGNYQVGVVGADNKLEIRTIKTTGQVSSMSIVTQGLSAGRGDRLRSREVQAGDDGPRSREHPNRPSTSAGPSAPECGDVALLRRPPDRGEW
jgi:membrane fusion protein (multidrug efflux system)